MVKLTKETKKYKFLYILTAIFSWACFLGPTAYFMLTGFIGSTLTVHKITLTTALVAVLIMTAISLVNKIPLTSRIWILFLGLTYVLSSINFRIELIVIAIAVGQILHELVFEPLKGYFKNKYRINKEIDKRNDV